MSVLPVVFAIFWAHKFVTPGRVGLLMMSEVLVAVISASLLLPDKRMTTIEWGGAILIISVCLIEILVTFQPKPELSLTSEAPKKNQLVKCWLMLAL